MEVGIIMGSTSDYEVMSAAADILQQFGVEFEKSVISAHRAPQKTYEYASNAAKRGLKVIIAGAGGAAHLPGVVAAMTTLPVIGVPVKSMMAVSILALSNPELAVKLEEFRKKQTEQVLNAQI